MQEKKEEDLQQELNKVFEVGIDEVGKGAIFGPVFSAAVVLTEKNLFILKQFGVKDSNKNTEKKSDNKKTQAKQIKKVSKSEEEKIQIKIEADANSKDNLTNKTNENNEVVFIDKKNEIELTDELNNARKKRRRSSASIE